METFDKIMITLLFFVTFLGTSMVIREQNQKQIQELAKIVCEYNGPKYKPESKGAVSE